MTFLENYLEYWQCQHLVGILTSSLGEGQRVKLAVRLCYLEVCHFYRRTHNLISFMGIKLSHSSPSHSPNFHTLCFFSSFLLCLPKLYAVQRKEYIICLKYQVCVLGVMRLLNSYICTLNSATFHILLITMEITRVVMVKWDYV